MSGRPDLRLLGPALAVWLTTVLVLHVPAQVGLLMAVGAASAAIAAFRSSLLFAVGLSIAAACCATAVRVHARESGPLRQAALAHAAVRVDAVISDDPHAVAGKPGGLAFREVIALRVRVERLEVAGRSVRLRAPVLVLAADPSWLRVLPSQRIRAEGLLRPAHRAEDVAALLSARGAVEVRGPPSGIQRLAGSLRAGLRRAVSPLPAAERGLLPGLVVGDVSGLDPQVRDDFRTTGLSHLVAVSGTNVAVVLGAVLLVCIRCGVPLRARAPVALVALLGFMVLARPSPSVLRAGVMGGIGLLALTTGRPRAALPALSAAIGVLVLVSPDLAVSPGFALSVLATAGLVIVAPGWRTALGRWLPDWLAAAVAIPAAAQLACGPVIVAMSGQLGLLSIPANLLAVPAVAPATVLGLGAAVIAPASGTLATGVAWLAWLPAAWLVRVAAIGAALPGAAVGWPSGLAGAALLVAAMAAGLSILRVPTVRRALLACGVGVLLASATLRAVTPGWPPAGWFLVACDVGQGDALVLAAGPHAAVVIDTGPDPRAMDGCLRRLGARRVPLVILTHLHADHVEGLPGVLRGRTVDQIAVGPLDEPAVERARVLRWASERHVSVVRAQVGLEGIAGQAVWRVLAPATAHRGTDSDPNNSSLVLRLTAAGGTTVLLTGDVEREAQQALLDLGVPLQADVLKTPHHGSSHQLPEFLDAVGARITLTSVGAQNPYGHPSTGTLRRLIDLGARSYRTDRDGDIALVSRGGVLSSAARRGEGTTARPSAATGLERVPGTTFTAPVAQLMALPGTWCGSPPPSARSPPPSSMER